MSFYKRTLLLCYVFMALVILFCCKSQTIAPGAEQVLVESTDPALRLEWFEQHTAMKAETPTKDLKWRFLGPDIIGGRCTDIAVPLGSKTTIYVGTATGGLWKTLDAGETWTPIFDEMPTMSIGDIAIPETAPDIIYVGTGEANIFRASLAGSGIYKSTDGGATWQHMGLAGTQTIARIRIHPTNPNIVYVAASGHEWTYTPDRGVYKTTDGGQTWQKILYINEKAGAIDLVMNPENPDVLIASMWNRIRRRWSDPVPEGGDHLFKTTDGGANWKELTEGLPPTEKTGRIGIDLCRTKPNVVYAYVDNHTALRVPEEGERDSYGRLRTYPDIVGAEVYRSDDLGETWKKVSPSNRMFERFGGTYGWVFGQIRVDPNEENTIYLMGLGLHRSKDGGKTWERIRYEKLHGDHHGLWIDPADSNYLINANDGGTNLSRDGGKTWKDFYNGIPSIQFYNVAYDMSEPFNVYGSVQDWGTYRAVGVVPAVDGKAPMPKWERAPGGEGTHIAIDPTNPKIVYSSSFYGRVERAEYTNGKVERKKIFPQPGPDEPEYRGQWLAATILSPHDPSTVYHGFQYVFRSTDKGETWEKISDDLTAYYTEKQGKLPYAIKFATITAISESPLKAGILYVGSDDGRIHVTKDGGETWTEITAGLPYYKHVWSIVASKYDESTVYISLIGRHDDDFMPYVFKSKNYGKTWKSITANLPGGPTNVIREDPKKKNVLYVGSDLGVYITTSGGRKWNSLGSGLPNAPVWDLQIHPRDDIIVIATNGRGMWVFDDVAKARNSK